jgi:hypothetical protein
MRSIPIAILTCILWISTNNAMQTQQRSNLCTEFLDIMGRKVILEKETSLTKAVYLEILRKLPMALLQEIVTPLKTFDTCQHIAPQEQASVIEKLKALGKELDGWSVQDCDGMGRDCEPRFPEHAPVATKMKSALSQFTLKIRCCQTYDQDKDPDLFNFFAEQKTD